jgi:4-alpha-glucanotransferase
MTHRFNTINQQRRAGILLHPTSLPGPASNGDIGHQAYRFIEFMYQHGFKVWQMLPLGPTHDDRSPYQCLSSHAGNPNLISLDWLSDRGWLKSTHEERMACLLEAGQTFYQHAGESWHTRLNTFAQKHAAWLDDYALFMAFKMEYNNVPWYEWPEEVRHRDTAALEKARRELTNSIKQTVFEQFIFFTQWQEIRAYARQHQIELFGDMPIFVAHDSADVWAQRQNFLMDSDGDMKFIAGVPPDAFSDTGQRWGNPLYDWDYMRSTGYQWWQERFITQLELFDMVRIDHFRGLQACWQIPSRDETAMNGQWVVVPGREMLTTLYESLKQLPLVAEDLGVITDEVIELKDAFKLPGMKVLQFAFDGNHSNPHLPHHHQANDIIYTGTHDNDTTLGWANNVNNYNTDYFQSYTGTVIDSAEQCTWEMIRMAMASVSFLCVLPMQDVLQLGSAARMNTPGTVSGNWLWRFDWPSVNPAVMSRLTQLMTVYER